MNAAAEVKLRAERKAGEVLATMDKAKPGPAPEIDDSLSSISRSPRLPDLGITYKQSERWQTEASLPEPEFVAWVEERAEDGKPLSTAALVKHARAAGASQRAGVSSDSCLAQARRVAWPTILDWSTLMPRYRGGLTLGPTHILVVIALILTILDLLHIALGGIPLLPLAVLLLCLAWLVP